MQKFETTNRRLEGYLYMNEIRYEAMHKNEDGMTVWVYERTPWFEEVFALYRKASLLRQERFADQG